MEYRNRELWAAFAAILLITLTYFVSTVWLGEVPHSSDWIGHGIGILGFLLMVMTETLYSWRKRSRNARWGRMSGWLNFHIFTGIVGPYMVLLHSAWRFNGLAGITLLLTGIIVASGFVGRYIYTAVPRTVDGVEVESSQLEGQISALQAQIQIQLQQWSQVNPAAAQLLASLQSNPESQAGGNRLIFTRGLARQRERRQWRALRRKLDPDLRAQAEALDDLVKRQNTLKRQVASLTTARRTLALWHAVHVPIGLALFTAAAIHIVAAFYYATLLR